MIITQAPHNFIISFPFNPSILKAVKSIPGSRWIGARKYWTVPIHAHEQVDELRRKYCLAEKYLVPEIVKEVPPLPELTIHIPLKRKPFPYQEQGIAAGMQFKRFINGDDMGLGKTFQTVGTIRGAKLSPVLIICPATLRENWRREFAIATDLKVDIMTDSIKSTWPQFIRMGMVDVFIVNYESLKKYFVVSINKEKDKPLTLKNIKFRPEISLFKAIVIDESHKCFPYETKVHTDHGLLEIGFIVENNLSFLKVWSYDLTKKELSLKSITNVWKNELSGRNLYKLTHGRGTICATENHEIFTDTGRKKVLSEIQSGENLLALPEGFYDQESGANYGKVLFPQMRRIRNKRKSSLSGKDGQKQEKSKTHQGMCMVRRNLLINKYRIKNGQEVLRSKLFGKMENDAAGSSGSPAFRKEPSNKESECSKSKAQQGTLRVEKQQNERRKQPIKKSRNAGKNDSFQQGKNIFITGWQWANDGAAIKTMDGAEYFRKCFGVLHLDGASQRPIRKPATLLQSRYRNRINKISNRSGWLKPWNEEVEVSGQTQNRNLECVRVESGEIYQPTSVEQFGRGTERTQFVYDLEIADNHNYFAEGILVSNCKDSSTAQAKFCKGICKDKEWVMLLTGTPVQNKTKDLISQLSIMGRLEDFGGFQFFMKRYCGGDGKGNTNLRELNYKLGSTCFFRRLKKDVLKDLPDKTRSVYLCDITTRKEYNDAMADFANYLKEYTEKTDSEIQRSMRAEVLVRMTKCKNISARGKMNEVIEYIDEIVEAGEKVVVFIHQKEIALHLLRHYPKAVSVRGDDKPDQKQASVDNFQSDPRVQIIICSIKAAGVGITLTASSRVAFVELPWHSADTDQCEDRCNRLGQKNAVQATYFLGKGTIDEDIYEIIESKRAVAGEVTGTPDDIQRILIDKMAAKLLGKENF